MLNKSDKGIISFQMHGLPEKEWTEKKHLITNIDINSKILIVVRLLLLYYYEKKNIC